MTTHIINFNTEYERIILAPEHIVAIILPRVFSSNPRTSNCIIRTIDTQQYYITAAEAESVISQLAEYGNEIKNLYT